MPPKSLKSKAKGGDEESGEKKLQKNSKKTAIPKAIKQLVWNFYIGEEIGKADCFCCNVTKITQLSFICGHVQAEANGGGVTVDNLRPICSMCNSSMSTKNMIEFMRTHGLKGKADDGRRDVFLQEDASEDVPDKTQIPTPEILEPNEVDSEFNSKENCEGTDGENDGENDKYIRSQPDSYNQKVLKVREYITSNWENIFSKQKPQDISKDAYIYLKSYDYNLGVRLGIYRKKFF